MESRREFLRSACIAGGFGAAGALTLKKDYVKPVVRLLEPGAAYAQTPTLSVGATTWTLPVMDFTLPATPFSNTLAITVDLPGGSAPIPGSTFNAFLSLTPLAEPGSGWATLSNIAMGSTVNSDTIDNIGTAGPGGVVQFALFLMGFPPILTINGLRITPFPPGPGDMTFGLSNLIGLGATGDRARVCCHVDADAGSTIGGTAYPAQAMGFWCFELLFS